MAGEGTKIREHVQIGFQEVIRPTTPDGPMAFACHACGKALLTVNYWIVKGAQTFTFFDCCDECAESGRGQTLGSIAKKEA